MQYHIIVASSPCLGEKNTKTLNRRRRKNIRHEYKKHIKISWKADVQSSSERIMKPTDEKKPAISFGTFQNWIMCNVTMNGTDEPCTLWIKPLRTRQHEHHTAINRYGTRPSDLDICIYFRLCLPKKTLKSRLIFFIFGPCALLSLCLLALNSRLSLSHSQYQLYCRRCCCRLSFRRKMKLSIHSYFTYHFLHFQMFDILDLFFSASVHSF